MTSFFVKRFAAKCCKILQKLFSCSNHILFYLLKSVFVSTDLRTICKTNLSQILQWDQLCLKELQDLLHLMLQIVATTRCCSILESKILFSILQNQSTLNLNQFSQYYVVCRKMQQKCCLLPQP